MSEIDEAQCIAGMPEETYHANPRISNSKLKDLHSDPYDFYLRHVANEYLPFAASSDMKIGTATHSLCLGGTEILTYPDECLKSNGAINSKPAAEFREENPEALVLTKKEHKAARQTAAAIKRHEFVGTWLDCATHREVTFFWTDHNIGMRSRCDFIVETPGLIQIFDLKITTSVNPRMFRKRVRQFKYWVQHVHYTRGCEKYFDKPCEFYFITASPKGHHKVAVHQIRHGLDEAFFYYDRLLDDLTRRHEEDDWLADYEKDVNPIELDDYDFRREGSDE